MERLWAPWRMEYIEMEKSGECVFCTLPESGKDEKNYILYRGPLCFVIMNIFPYNNGHLMVSPYRHLRCITLLDDKEMLEIGRLTQKCVELLKSTHTPDAFNIGLNLGKAAGAGYDEHVHKHIVPRWHSDTNFMPVIADTKVHPQSLRKGYEKLYPLFQKITL